MTDEERQNLCEVLRTTECWTDTTDLLLKMAADEIERMVKELAEFNAIFRAAAIELGDPRTRQKHPERQRKF